MDCDAEGISTIYDLYAVTNHFGSLNGGHYTAFGKNDIDGKWYNFNDSSVGRANPESVRSSAAYILFYKRRNFTGKIPKSPTSASEDESTKATSSREELKKEEEFVYSLD
mmetsp:Transcript_31098/g.47493  ORF Transcript_31098/g.47493 Transcript_31098/m.47493 type:complete len:110 (-) Transcript_31098:16-345(-)